MRFAHTLACVSDITGLGCKYSYYVRKCKQCPGCALSNPTMKINELVYKFPIDVPFNVLHVDEYKAGKHFNFEGTGTYIIATCGMTGFAACKPVADESATTYASTVMKIMLRQNTSHPLVLNMDSTFFGIFRQVVGLLQLNCDILSGGHRAGQLLELVNHFLNKSLRTMTNE